MHQIKPGLKSRQAARPSLRGSRLLTWRHLSSAADSNYQTAQQSSCFRHKQVRFHSREGQTRTFWSHLIVRRFHSSHIRTPSHKKGVLTSFMRAGITHKHGKVRHQVESQGIYYWTSSLRWIRAFFSYFFFMVMKSLHRSRWWLMGKNMCRHSEDYLWLDKGD